MFGTRSLRQARAVAKVLKVRVERLRKYAKSKKPRKAVVITFVKKMLSIYLANEKKPHLPGDYVDMLSRTTRAKTDAYHWPCLRSTIALAKYCPYRDALTKAAKSYKVQFLKSVPGVQGVGVYTDMAKVMYNILVRTCRNVNGKCKKELATWARTIGKGVHHHHGFVPLIVSLGIAQRSPRGPVHLGAARVHIVPWCKAVAGKLTRFLHNSHLLESKVSEVMKRVKRGRLHIKEILKVKQTIMKNMCPMRYHNSWHFRAMLMSMLHQCNIKVLPKRYSFYFVHELAYWANSNQLARLLIAPELCSLFPNL
jgi:hypothetical protein